MSIPSEGQMNARRLRLEGFAASIEDCATVDGLRDLLRTIAASGLSEQEFSDLYSGITARKNVLLGL